MTLIENEGPDCAITEREQKASSTPRDSQAVPHPSTNRALRCLTAEFGRDPVFSTRYGRWHQVLAESDMRGWPYFGRNLPAQGGSIVSTIGPTGDLWASMPWHSTARPAACAPCMLLRPEVAPPTSRFIYGSRIGQVGKIPPWVVEGIAAFTS